MEVIINLYTQDEETHKAAMEIPRGNVTLDTLVSPFRELYDTIIHLATRGKKVTCKKGCSACCVQMVPLSIPEVFYLDMLIDSLPAAHKKRVKQRFAKNKNRLHASGLLAGLKDPGKARTMDEAYFRLGMECPFLESGICSIYHDRPFVCREYYVVSPAGLCTSPYTSSIQKTEIYPNIGAMLSSFTARLVGLASTPIPHIITRDWAEQFRYLGKKRFPADWMFDKIFHVLSTIEPEKGNIKKIEIAKTV